MATHRFGTAVACIDGRIQEPVARWLRQTYQLDFVDMVTEPGADGVLANGAPEVVQALRAKVEASISRHASSVVAVVGHYDCAGNPVSPEEHQQHIRAALHAVRLWNLSATVVGLWVNESGAVQSAAD